MNGNITAFTKVRFLIPFFKKLLDIFVFVSRRENSSIKTEDFLVKNQINLIFNQLLK